MPAMELFCCVNICSPSNPKCHMYNVCPHKRKFHISSLLLMTSEPQSIYLSCLGPHVYYVFDWNESLVLCLSSTGQKHCISNVYDINELDKCVWLVIVIVIKLHVSVCPIFWHLNQSKYFSLGLLQCHVFLYLSEVDLWICCFMCVSRTGHKDFKGGLLSYNYMYQCPPSYDIWSLDNISPSLLQYKMNCLFHVW